MKEDQIIRAVAAVGTVAAYGIHVGINGGESIRVFGTGPYHPFAVTLGVLLTITFPELLERAPIGPTRKKK